MNIKVSGSVPIHCRTLLESQVEDFVLIKAKR
ncbi:hypothetical protein AGR7C_Lc140116 [Agrobacterium deltaense Zutra 3/1]|uniref:Uncharacterized protein n=1 Tax=Agrobacterium deltaense Zutra 3/1 TaxID=1183427 RepID=A0A1S7RAC7_9HYPH|nr:hypothetical protein AGR7C_Lc140116 [Agrobacterium deltaense Zutra 3/1]